MSARVSAVGFFNYHPELTNASPCLLRSSYTSAHVPTLVHGYLLIDRGWIPADVPGYVCWQRYHGRVSASAGRFLSAAAAGSSRSSILGRFIREDFDAERG